MLFAKIYSSYIENPIAKEQKYLGNGNFDKKEVSTWNRKSCMDICGSAAGNKMRTDNG